MLNRLPLDEKKHLVMIVFFVLFLFASGFFIQYGREARASGSWKYIITHEEEWLYWTYAQTYSQASEKGLNPFTYEERHSFPVLPHPTTQAIGALARLFHVSVLFFFPFWHIGIPLLVWLALFLSLWRFWKYPLMPSAAVSLILCLTTLHLKGVYPWILTRFPRPADFLGVTILCLSFIMTARKLGKISLFVLNLFAATAIWIAPFLAATGLVVFILETLWQAFVEKNKKRALWLGSSVGCFLVSAGIYFFHARNIALSSSLFISYYVKTPYHPSFSTKALPALILFALIAGMVLGIHFYKRRGLSKIPGPHSLSSLERLTLYMFLTEPVFTLAYMIFPNGTFYELEVHRYMNFLIQFAVLSAWAWESFRQIRDREILNRIFLPMVLLLTLITGALLSFPKTNFLLLGSRELMFGRENSRLLLSLICPILLIVLLIGKYPGLKRLVQKRICVVILSMSLCFSGFALFPSNTRLYNERFPFDGAYAWLKKNASFQDVVLSPSTIYSRVNYLLFYTGLRSYSSSYGEGLSSNREASSFRNLFIFSLINGVLDAWSLHGLKTLEEKIGHLRMDYVLIPRWSPFKEDVQRQLADHLTQVYEDGKAILWKISSKPALPEIRNGLAGEIKAPTRGA